MACRRRRSSSSISPHGLLSLSLSGLPLLIIVIILFAGATAAASGTKSPEFPLFREASAFRNGESCGGVPDGANGKTHVHVAMTLDANYIRGTMAAVFSILQHSTCPENVVFHFLWLKIDPEISSSIRSTFPYLSFRLYRFESNWVRGKISKSIREALDQPLNYARIYLADILPRHVNRVIYLDSDLVVVDDINKLWDVDLEQRVVGAPEYCHANFTRYFSDAFWSNPELASSAFEGRRRACYFNTGVMVVDVEKWRRGSYTEKVERWMAVQKKTRIYHLGSLPPFLLVFAGNIKAIDHRWNQHGLGGDNLEGKCRKLHSGSISLLHWSGKGKPWLRLDSRKPCSVDHLWAPYDLALSSQQSSFLE